MPLVLDLRALGDRVAHSHEEVLEPLPGLGDDVAVAQSSAPIKFGEVHALGFQPDCAFTGLQFHAATFQKALQRRPGVVQA